MPAANRSRAGGLRAARPIAVAGMLSSPLRATRPLTSLPLFGSDVLVCSFLLPFSGQMEGLEFAAFTHRHGIPAAMACVALINRLDGDQVTSPPSQIAAWEADLIRLIVGFVHHRLEEEVASATEAGAS